MEEFFLNATPRSDFGSKAARRLRQQGLLPANIYGHKVENLAISLDAKEFLSFFDAGHRVVTIRIDGKAEHGVIKEVQYDAFGTVPVHVDFSRIRKDERIVMEVPVETLGVPKGVTGGGVLEFPLRELRVEGPASAIPERIGLNIEELKIGESIRVKEVVSPAGCKIVDDLEQVVIAVAASRVVPEAAPEEAAPTEPEVVGRKKEAEEEKGDKGDKDEKS